MQTWRPTRMVFLPPALRDEDNRRGASLLQQDPESSVLKTISDWGDHLGGWRSVHKVASAQIRTQNCHTFVFLHGDLVLSYSSVHHAMTHIYWWVLVIEQILNHTIIFFIFMFIKKCFSTCFSVHNWIVFFLVILRYVFTYICSIKFNRGWWFWCQDTCSQYELLLWIPDSSDHKSQCQTENGNVESTLLIFDLIMRDKKMLQ